MKESDAYPIGGVWPSPLSSIVLLCCSLNMTISVLFNTKLAYEEFALLNSIRKHKTSLFIMENLKFQPKYEY